MNEIVGPQNNPGGISRVLNPKFVFCDPELLSKTLVLASLVAGRDQNMVTNLFQFHDDLFVHLNSYWRVKRNIDGVFPR